jgi:hypothetical protein
MEEKRQAFNSKVSVQSASHSRNQNKRSYNRHYIKYYLCEFVYAPHSKLIILWRNRPMREVMKFRNLKERDCATVAERCRVLPPLPWFRVLLGYAVITWSRNSKEGQRDLSDITRNNTQRCVLRVSDSSVDRRD